MSDKFDLNKFLDNIKDNIKSFIQPGSNASSVNPEDRMALVLSELMVLTQEMKNHFDSLKNMVVQSNKLLEELYAYHTAHPRESDSESTEHAPDAHDSKGSDDDTQK